jgi:hypothetical protein
MGIASYREDIYLRFLDATDPAPDAAIVGSPYETCPFCGKQFTNQVTLIEHLSGDHRGDRPILLFSGREPDRHHNIHYRLQENRIVVQNCTTARLRINGDELIEMPTGRVAHLLAAQADSTVDLELVNRFDISAEPVRQAYHLTIRAPEKRTLDCPPSAPMRQIGRVEEGRISGSS